MRDSASTWFIVNKLKCFEVTLTLRTRTVFETNLKNTANLAVLVCYTSANQGSETTEIWLLLLKI